MILSGPMLMYPGLGFPAEEAACTAETELALRDEKVALPWPPLPSWWSFPGAAALEVEAPAVAAAPASLPLPSTAVRAPAFPLALTTIIWPGGCC